MNQSLPRRDFQDEFARRERAGRYLRVREALRAEAARSATIGVASRRWWWPWSLLRDAPQNLPDHLPWEADLGHLKRDLNGDKASVPSKDSAYHRTQDVAGGRPDCPARDVDGGQRRPVGQTKSAREDNDR